MAKHRPSAFHRFLLLVVLDVVRHPKRTLLIAGMLVLATSLFAVWRLDHSSDQDALFSSDVPFFRHYLEFTKDFPENQANYVIIEPRDRDHPPAVARWIEIADAITDRLRQQTKFVKTVDSHVPLEELGPQGLLFEDPARVQQDVTDAARMLPLAKLWGEAPDWRGKLLGSSPLERFLSGLGAAEMTGRPIDSETASFVGLLADGWNKTLADVSAPVRVGNQVPDLAALGATDPSRLGYYYVADEQDPTNHLLLVRIFEREDYSSMGGMAQTIDGIRKTAYAAAADFPEFKIGLTGRPTLEADEMVTTDRDSRNSEIVALIAVFIGLTVLLRSIWLAVAAEIALLVGIGWTFGWATVATMPYTHSTRGELNLLSMVFLIALIGIGMDYLIQVLTRYRREANRHSDPEVIWAGVFKYVAAPINTACLGAAGAFFVSVFTKFRGAAELGVIASGGLLLCLATGYVILPPLLTLFPPRVSTWKESPNIVYSSKRSYHWWLVLPLVWAILLAIGVPFARKAHFDSSLLNMQAKNLESVQLVRKLQTWFSVELSQDLNLLRKVRASVQHLSAVAGTESVLTAYDNYDWLTAHQKDIDVLNWAAPQAIHQTDLSRLAGKARSLAHRLRIAAPAVTTQPSDFASAATSLEHFAAAVEKESSVTASRLSEWQALFVDHLKEILAPFHPAPLDLEKLPATLRGHLIGKDGRFALYIYPRQDLWNQENLGRFVHQTESAVGSIPDAPLPTGIAPDIYHSTSSIEGSFYRSTGYALGLIFILVLIDLRNIRQTILAISVLGMGLPMLVALMGLFDVSWNFANFFGLPILIGAGHEYGVFMVHRYNEACRDPRRSWQRWDVSDRALLLCAFVTTASFGFFWALGHHEGLKSLGLVMALGTACIYLATMCMLRPLLLWKLAHRKITGEPCEAEFSLKD